MNGIKIVQTCDVQDLGITVDDTLTWRLHINKMVKKAHSRAWLCMRALGFHAYIKAKRTCFITMVRSILEYCSVIWSTSFKYLIIAIENIQRRATNYILSNPKMPSPLHINYKERLLTLNLLPLTYRRELIDLQHFLKTWNSPDKLGLDKVLQFSQPNQGRVTRAMAAGLTLNFTKTRLLSTSHFYPYRLSQTWNKLPLELRGKMRHMTDTSKIKRLLTPYYFVKLADTFDPNDTCTWVTHCDCPKCRPV